MRAITVIPGQPGSVELTELPDPEPKEGELLVEPLYLGVCGTDREIVEGVPRRAAARPASASCSATSCSVARRDTGELVVGIVRRPDPVPCACCAQGEWDMCRNGQYTERGIKALDGYGAELVTLEEDFAIPIPAELGDARGPHRAGQRARQGLGADRPHQHARVLGARACTRDRRRPDRPARGADGRTARARAPRARPRRPRVRSRRRCRLSAARYHTGDVTEVGGGNRAGPRGGVHRRGRAGGGRHAAHGARGDRVPHRRGAVAHPERGRGRAQQRARARERRHIRVGEREPAPLRAGRQIADGRRPGLASPADHPHACRSTAGPRRSTKGDDDIKVVVEFATR